MKRKIVFIYTIAVFLVGCSVVSGFFDGRALNNLKDAKEPADVIENIQWAVERLELEDEYAPEVLAELLPLARSKAESIQLEKADPTLYNQLIERYAAIALNGVKTTDPEEWQEKGYRYEITNDYLRASSAYQLGRLKGDAIASQLLVLLRKLDSPSIQAVLLKSMIERVDAYKKNDEIRAQAISALSNVDIASLEPGSVLASQLSKLESELVTLPMLNRVLNKKDIYQLTQRNLSYILDLNEGVWLYLMANPEKIVKADVITNSRMLSSLALPQVEQLDGKVPSYTPVEREAQRLLLQYTPGLYYFSMFNHAKTSDYSLGQLVAAKEYMDRYESYAVAGKGNIIASGDEKKAFFNHHVIMNETIYSQTAEKAKKMLFASLYNRVETRPLEYVDFVYSYLNVNFSKEFAAYLLSSKQQKYRAAGIDALQHYYALTLLDNDAISENNKKQLLALVKNAQLTRTLKYSESELKDYAERVYPTFIEKDSTALLEQLHAKYRNVSKQKGYAELTDYYIVALDTVDASKRGAYLDYAGAVIATHHPESTKKLMGAYRKVPLSDSESSLKNIAFKNTTSTPPESYIYLGNYIDGRKSELNGNLAVSYGGIFNQAITTEKSDDSALVAAQQGMMNVKDMRSTFNQSISKRLPGVEL